MKSLILLCTLAFGFNAHADLELDKMKEAIGLKMTVVIDIPLDNFVDVGPESFWAPTKNMIVDGKLYDPVTDGLQITKDSCTLSLFDFSKNSVVVPGGTVSAIITGTRNDNGFSTMQGRFGWGMVENETATKTPGAQLHEITCERYDSSKAIAFKDIERITKGVIKFEKVK